MLNHIVFLGFKKELKENEIQIILNSLGDLQKLIPEILSFSAGKNNSKEALNKDYTHAFMMTFATEEARDIYIDHEAHTKVAKEIVMPALEDGLNSVVVLDFST